MNIDVNDGSENTGVDINVGVPGIPVTTITGGNTIEVVGATDYSASVMLFSYSNDAKRLPFLNALENTTVGVNLKYYSQDFLGGGVAGLFQGR